MALKPDISQPQPAVKFLEHGKLEVQCKLHTHVFTKNDIWSVEKLHPMHIQHSPGTFALLSHPITLIREPL